MRNKLLYPAAALAAYGLFILYRYGMSYAESASLAGFGFIAITVIGGKLAFIAALAASAYGAAGLIPKRFSPEYSSLIEEGLIRVSLGLIVISYIMYAAGLVGILYRPVGFLVLAGGMAAGWRDIFSYAKRLASTPRVVRFGIANIVLMAVSAYFLLTGIAAALLPPTGFDVLMYHLGVPRMYIDAHRIIPTPDVNGSAFPFGIEMLYMLGMLVDGVIAANMVNFAFAVMGGLAAAAFMRRFVPGASGLAAFTVYVSIPMVVWLMPQAYIELAQAAYAMVAVYALASWVSGRDKGWLVAAALLTGYSMSIKYTGVMVVGILTVLVLAVQVVADREGIKKAVTLTGVFLAVAVAVSAPWYIKNVIQFGNPVYPFLAGVFGSAQEVVSAQQAGHASGGLGGAFAGFVRSLWATTLDARSFQMGWANGLGPCLLMLIPGAALFGRPRREMAVLMLYCLAFYAALFFRLEGSYVAEHLGNLRYAAPILPALAVIAAYPIEKLTSGESVGPRLAGTALALVMAFGAMMSATPLSTVQSYPAASARATDEYYSRPSWGGFLASYQIWNWINANLPQDAVVYQLWDDASVYFRRRTTIGFPLPMTAHGRHKLHYVADPIGRFDHARGFLPGEAVINNLKGMGAGYLLINANREGHSVPEDAYFRSHVELVASFNGVYLFRLH